MLSDIYNFRQADDLLATSGQPKEAHFPEMAAAGYQAVINLALHDDPRYSLPDERSAVEAAGMEYVHIPVQFSDPKEADLLAYFDAMDRLKGRRIWVHCAANMRVTAFVGLYRVLRQQWEVPKAFELMRDVWEPKDTWARFIDSQLARPPVAW